MIGAREGVTKSEDSRAVSEAVRHKMTSAPIDTPGGPLTIRVSLGVASTAGAAAPRTADDLVQAADQALYRAKAGGRDRVETAPEPPAR